MSNFDSPHFLQKSSASMDEWPPTRLGFRFETTVVNQEDLSTREVTEHPDHGPSALEDIKHHQDDAQPQNDTPGPEATAHHDDFVPPKEKAGTAPVDSDSLDQSSTAPVDAEATVTPGGTMPEGKRSDRAVMLIDLETFAAMFHMAQGHFEALHAIKNIAALVNKQPTMYPRSELSRICEVDNTEAVKTSATQAGAQQPVTQGSEAGEFTHILQENLEALTEFVQLAIESNTLRLKEKINETQRSLETVRADDY